MAKALSSARRGRRPARARGSTHTATRRRAPTRTIARDRRARARTATDGAERGAREDGRAGFEK